MRRMKIASTFVLLVVLALPIAARSEILPNLSPVTDAFDHERVEVMIPMRDGGADHPHAHAVQRGQDEQPARGDDPAARGNIRIYEDVRGRYDSEGNYIMTLPPRGELNRWNVDQTTDTYNTIEWLVKNVKGNNGRVGITGVSYPGWLTLMGILEPHPALKAAVPMYPMVDGWIGDDFYHNGALRQTMLEWSYNMGAHKKSDYTPPIGYRDRYEIA